MSTVVVVVVALLLMTAEAAPPSAYEVLQAHGLPRGLLPKGVREFAVDGDGRFEAHLDAACTASRLEGAVRYARNVSGTLSYGQMTYLSGMSAQELFLWFPVRGIQVRDPNSGLIFFDVAGLVSKQFSLSLFEVPPDCSPAPELSKYGGKPRYDLGRQENSAAYAAV